MSRRSVPVRPRPRRRSAWARRAVLVGWCVLAAACAGCGGSSGGDRSGDGRSGEGAGDTAAEGSGGTVDGASPDGGGPSAARMCADAALDPGTGVVAADGLTELSGLAASRRDEGVLWGHNDSGGAPEVFALDIRGTDLGSVLLDGAEARDWEDMAVGPAPDGAGDVLYLGDIGDNAAEREDVTIYRVPEPAVPGEGAGPASATGVEALTLTYADGPRDAETLLADPVTGDLFVVGKAWDGGPTGVHRVPADAPWGGGIAVDRVADAGLPGPNLVTGGDVSPDGSLVALRTYGGILVWDRGPDESVADALAGEPCAAPAVLEGQGEAVAFTADGTGYVTVSEGSHPPVNVHSLR